MQPARSVRLGVLAALAVLAAGSLLLVGDRHLVAPPGSKQVEYAVYARLPDCVADWPGLGTCTPLQHYVMGVAWRGPYFDANTVYLPDLTRMLIVRGGVPETPNAQGRRQALVLESHYRWLPETATLTR